MFLMRQFVVAGVSSSLFLITNLYAAQTQLSGTSAKGLSLEGAFTALADDTSAVFYNPAGMTQLKGTNLEFGNIMAFPKLKMEDDQDNLHLSRKKTTANPYLFAVSDIVHPIHLGLGTYVPFAGSSHWVSGPGGFTPRRSQISRTDYTLAAAYEVFPSISIGGGPTISYGQIDGNSTRGFGVLTEEAWGFGFGGIVGILYKPFDFLQMGVAYRLRETVRLHGTASRGAGNRDNFFTPLHYPSAVNIGLAVKPIKPLKFLFNIDWVEWSFYKVAARKFESLIDVIDPVEAKDIWEPRVGIEYQFASDFSIRAGYLFDVETAPSRNIAPTAFDIAFHEIGFGLSKKIKSVTLSAAYNVARGEKRTVGDAETVNGIYDLKAHALTLAIGLPI